MLVNNYKCEDPKDLHDMLTIIVISIIDTDFNKYCELTEDAINESFIKNLIKLVNTKITDSNNNYKRIIEVIKNTPFKNSFKICKTIYEGYKSDPKLVNKLFQQFKKYNTYTGANNEIWTSNIVSNLMFSIAERYIKKTDNKITILDPCIGMNSLIYPFIDNIRADNIVVKGCDISTRLALMSKLDLLIKGVDNVHIYKNDFIESKQDLKANICVCNPQYTRNVSNGYDCLDFVINAAEYAKTSIFIFPKNRLTKNKKLNKEFLATCKLLEVIELGDNIFKGVSTGDIVIIVVQKLKDKNKDIKTEYYDIKALSKEFKNIPHVDTIMLSDKGKQLITDFVNGAVDYKEYTPTVDNMVPSDSAINLEAMKDNLIKPIEKEISNLSNMLMLSKDYKQKIIRMLLETINKIKSMHDIVDILKYNNKDADILTHIRLMDYFEIVKFKSTTINDSTIGDYPLFGASKDDEPVKYIDKYTIDTKGEDWIQLNKDGSAGYCFVRNGKFSLNGHCLLFRLKSAYKNEINLKLNVKLLSIQLTNMGFGFTNAISADILKTLEVYISC